MVQPPKQIDPDVFPVVYLAGHITQDDYREEAGQFLEYLGCKVLNPFRPEHDLRGKEEGAAEQIVQWDLEDVTECDAILANFSDMSVGTSMECWYGHSLRRPIFPFVELDAKGNVQRISPWITYIAYEKVVSPSLPLALERIQQIWAL